MEYMEKLCVFSVKYGRGVVMLRVGYFSNKPCDACLDIWHHEDEISKPAGLHQEAENEKMGLLLQGRYNLLGFFTQKSFKLV